MRDSTAAASSRQSVPFVSIATLPEARQLSAPFVDLERSPAALAVGKLAAEAGLFLFDYESRVELELPDHWLPIGRPDLGVTGTPPGWDRGLRGESKYLSFRHDTLLGSLHPGHRAKWTAHELCHGLVGFCWRADASVLFHALAARLAESLPVALWYFLDEYGLTRCDRHRGQTEVPPAFCRACELAQRHGARERVDDTDRDWRLRGRQFLARELSAARDSIRLGRPVFAPHGHIDLMTDGLNYASAHLLRLRAPEFQSQIAHFFAHDANAGSGWFDSLEAFAAHIEALGEALLSDSSGFVRLVGGRNRFIAQDLGARLLQVAADTDGECHAALSALVADLGAASHTPRAEAAIAETLTRYASLYEDFELPEPADVFAVGYDLPDGYGHGLSQLREGLATALGATVERLEGQGRLDDLLARFVATREPSRAPIGRRFASFLESAGVDPTEVGLARLEAAIADSRVPDPAELALGFDGFAATDDDVLVLAEGVELVRTGYDAGGLLMHGSPKADGPRAFLVRRDAGDQVGLVAIGDALAARLERGPLPAIEVLEGMADPELAALVEEGLVVPQRWELGSE